MGLVEAWTGVNTIPPPVFSASIPLGTWGYGDEPWATERSREGRRGMVPELRMVGLALGGRVPPPLPLLPVPPPLRVSCREES